MAYTYTILVDKNIVKRNDGAFVPVDNSNSDWSDAKKFFVSSGLWSQENANTNTLSALTIDNINTFLPPLIPLEDIKKEAKRYIDNVAGGVRSKYITTSPGQEAIYIMKADDAQKFKNDGYPIPTLGSYPFVAAEAVATAKTPQQAADDIIAIRNAWVTKGSEIEQARILGKTAIHAATNESEVNDAKTDAYTALIAL